MRINNDGVYKVFFVSNWAASSSILNLRAILKTTTETIIIQKISAISQLPENECVVVRNLT